MARFSDLDMVCGLVCGGGLESKSKSGRTFGASGADGGGVRGDVAGGPSDASGGLPVASGHSVQAATLARVTSGERGSGATSGDDRKAIMEPIQGGGRTTNGGHGLAPCRAAIGSRWAWGAMDGARVDAVKPQRGPMRELGQRYSVAIR